MGILDKAVEKYGERQLDQAQEELAELIVAISKYKRVSAKGERQLRESIGIVIEKVANMICIETEDGFKAVNVKTIVNIFKYEKKVECEFMQQIIWNYYEVNGVRLLKIKDLIKKLEELDGEKTIGVYDYEEGKEDLNLIILHNNYTNGKSDYLIE